MTSTLAPKLIAAILLTCTLVGCTSLDSASIHSPFDVFSENSGKASTENSRTAKPVVTCMVDFHSKANNSRRVEIPVKEGMCVQDLIVASHAQREFGRFNVELARKLPNGNWHKMNVTFDNGKNRVDPTHDYAIRPGDHLIVTEDPTSTFERMLKAMIGKPPTAFALPGMET